MVTGPTGWAQDGRPWVAAATAEAEIILRADEAAGRVIDTDMRTQLFDRCLYRLVSASRTMSWLFRHSTYMGKGGFWTNFGFQNLPRLPP